MKFLLCHKKPGYKSLGVDPNPKQRRRSRTLHDSRGGEKDGPIVDSDEETTHVLAQLPAGPVLPLLCRIRVILLLPFPVHFYYLSAFGRRKQFCLPGREPFFLIYSLCEKNTTRKKHAYLHT